MKSAVDAIVELQSYGVASTADKFLEQIKQEVAESKAAVEVATGSIDTQGDRARAHVAQGEGRGHPARVRSRDGSRQAGGRAAVHVRAERRRPGRREAGLVNIDGRRAPEDISAGSILRELIFNQYQAIVAAGAVLASALTLNPLPLLLWLGSELVLLPILDSGPLRRLVARRRRDAARLQSAERRKSVIASFDAAHAKRYAALEELCRMIETNYQSLHRHFAGLPLRTARQARQHSRQLSRIACWRCSATRRCRSAATLTISNEEIANLERELNDGDLNERARAALQKNLELKRRLLRVVRARSSGTMKALATELDSMASLLEVLHQNSISLRDPQAISEELDTIVRQSEDSERVVREMEALLGRDSGSWSADVAATAVRRERPKVPPIPTPPRQKVKGR